MYNMSKRVSGGSKDVPKQKAAVPVESEKGAVIPASVDDYAAWIRNTPVIDASAVPAVPEGVPTMPDEYIQRDLRKLDGELAAESDVAIHELIALGSATLAQDLGPTTNKLPDLRTLAARRDALRATQQRLSVLLSHVVAQQKVADHDTILALESVADAVGFFAKHNTALEVRYAATLAVLAKRGAKVSAGLARAKAADKSGE
jgi:hypothetical protein